MPGPVMMTPVYPTPNLPPLPADEILRAMRELKPSLYYEVAVFAQEYHYQLMKENYRKEHKPCQ